MADTSRIAIKHVLGAHVSVPRNVETIAVVREAIDQERERCARIVEKGLGRTNTTIARAIRNGESESAQ